MKATSPGRLPRRPIAFLLLAACVAGIGPARAAEPPRGLATAGFAAVPSDAAFLFSTLRAREQWDRFANSNAFAALRAIPAVKRALESLEEQRTTPGTVPSLVAAALELPENDQAVDLLADMVASDTFLYGEPSCTTFVQLLGKLSAAVQEAIAIEADGGVILEEEMFDDAEALEDGGEAAVRSVPRSMRCQFGLDVDELSAEARQKRLIVETLVENLDLVVAPDLVWGFRTTMPDAARAQLARLEKLAKSALAGNPELEDLVARRKVGEGDFLVLTLTGESLPWGLIEEALAEDAGDIEGFDDVLDRLRGIDLCVALGIVGDRVILSVGDTAEHLEKFPARAGAGLLAEPPFTPLVADAEKPLTTVWHVSAGMARAFGRSPEGVREQLEPMAERFEDAGLSAEAVEEARGLVERFADAVAERLPEPGAWTAYSFLTDTGYEGYSWDWSKNQPLDGGRRLDLLEHAGGAPLAVTVSRFRPDAGMIDEVATLVGGLWSIVKEEGMPALDGDDREQAEELAAAAEPIAGRLAEVVRRKLVPAVADAQVGLVLDAKSRTRKPQRDLPTSADPLPLPEPAIVLPLADAKLFREGLSELFSVADEAVAALREVAPDLVPPDFRVPEPEKAKVEAGTVWSFPLPDAGLDEQACPAIGVGDEVAVFSLAPKQAARLLGDAKLETASQLATFEEPLAGAAAADVAGIVDAVRPWLVYLTRYGCVREREGVVDSDEELDADDETKEAREALGAVDVVLEVAKCLRAAAAETALRDGAVVTHWRNIIRDLPKKP